MFGYLILRTFYYIMHIYLCHKIETGVQNVAIAPSAGTKRKNEPNTAHLVTNFKS